MSKHRSHITTTVECCHCVLQVETQQGVLSESYLPLRLPSFYMRRGLKDRWSQYRFLHSIFQQTLSASPLSAPSFFLFRNLSFLISSTCTLPVFIFVPSLYFSRCLSLSGLACATTLSQAPYSRIGGEKGTFRSPLLPFPKIPEGD